MHKLGEAYHQKYFDNNNYIHVALLHIRLMPRGTGLLSPVTLLFIRPIRTLLPQINRNPINISADDENHQAQRTWQEKYLKGCDACKVLLSFL